MDKDLYNQDLTQASKNTLRDFETFTKELLQSEKLWDLNFIRKKSNELFVQLSGNKEELYSVTDTTVKNEAGDYQIPVRNYKFGETPSQDLLIFVHGGGWSQGNLDTHDYLCRKLSKILGIDVVAVDYRLSPEHPYPTPLNDVFSVYKNCVSDQKYNKILICGDSAGANLCTALCSRVAKSDVKAPYAQILLYPPLNNEFDSGSYKAFEKCIALSKQGTMGFFSNYAGKNITDPSLNSNYEIFPLKNDDLNVYPKTMIFSAGHDVLLDDQVNFAKKLKAANKDVLHTIDKGALHGYMTYGRYYDDLVTENCKKIKAYVYGD